MSYSTDREPAERNIRPNVRRLMRQQRFTRDRLIDISGLPSGTVDHIISQGNTVMARVGPILAVADALGVTIDDLLKEPST